LTMTAMEPKGSFKLIRFSADSSDTSQYGARAKCRGDKNAHVE
jgi:hypothetical protein